MIVNILAQTYLKKLPVISFLNIEVIFQNFKIILK